MNFLKQGWQKIKVLFSLANIYIRDKETYAVIRRVRREKLTYLEHNALMDLYNRMRQVERENRSGIVVEAGCALGGSSLVIAAAKSQARPFKIYDAFETIPPPSDHDGPDAHTRYELISSGQATGIKGEVYYGYQQDLLESVRQTFRSFELPLRENSIDLVKGYYESTLQINSPIALAHIDCDWHDSVMICLQQIEPNLVPGGVIVIDDYEAWSGCKIAVDKYFAGREDEFDFVQRARLHIIRK